MIPTGHILVPTDFSPCSKRALGYAISIARRGKSMLHHFHVATPIETDPYGPIHHLPEIDASHEGVERLIHDLLVAEARELGADESRIEPVEVHGKTAASAIIDYAKKTSIDLIVMGTHGRRGIRHFLMGSVAEECVRRAECSVLTIRSDARTDRAGPEIRRILVPVDFSDFSLPLLLEAKEAAVAYGAELDLLYVVEPLPFPIAFSGTLTISDVVPSVRVAALQHLEALSREADLSEISHRLHVLDGHAAVSIIEFAESHPVDLIMIATEGRTAGERFLIGSVTERVVRASPCPVYIMKLRATQDQAGSHDEAPAETP